MAPKRKEKPYSDDDLIAAVAEIKNGNSYRSVSKKYNIPYTTLNDRVSGKVLLKKQQPGPTSNLSKDQEDRLSSFLVAMAKIGYGIQRREVPSLVKEILDKAEAEGYVIPEGKKFPDNK